MGCTVDDDLIFKPMGTAVPHTPKPTTLKEITGNADEVYLTSDSAEKSSTKWEFRIRTVASAGQEVFLMRSNRVVKEKVNCVRIHISQPRIQVMPPEFKVEFQICDEEGEKEWVNQEVCFATKADLLASL